VTETLTVLMHDTVAGNLERRADGRLRFTHATAYATDPTATPLSVSMPLDIATHTDEVVAPWLRGLLPDNDAVLQRWGRQFGVSAGSPFGLLGTPVGEDCAGAVRFCPPAEVERLLRRAGDIDWLSEAEIAQRIRDLREDGTSWLGRDFRGQFSLAGAQAKMALHRDGDRWGLPSGSTPTTHILKPAMPGFDGHELNEHLCLDAARRAGLTAARSSVERFGAESVIVVARYDRVVTSRGLERIHQEDGCQALSIAPARKYQAEGGPGARDIIGLLRRAIAPLIADTAVGRFIDALIWNWIIAGTDAHAKNTSILLAGREVRLAPMYDIASALPYGIHERKLRLAMKIGGSYDLFTLRDRWTRAAAEWVWDADRLTARVRELIRVTPDVFAEAAVVPAVVALGRPGPARLVDAVAARCARLEVQLAAVPPGG